MGQTAECPSNWALCAGRGSCGYSRRHGCHLRAGKGFKEVGLRPAPHRLAALVPAQGAGHLVGLLGRHHGISCIRKAECRMGQVVSSGWYQLSSTSSSPGRGPEEAPWGQESSATVSAQYIQRVSRKPLRGGQGQSGCSEGHGPHGVAASVLGGPGLVSRAAGQGEEAAWPRGPWIPHRQGSQGSPQPQELGNWRGLNTSTPS